MPPLGESYSRLVAVLDEFFGEPRPAAPAGSPFAGVLAAGLSRAPGQARRDALLTALDGLGLLHPETLAAVPPGELRDTLQEVGITISPAAASVAVRLARWFAANFPEADEPEGEGADCTRSSADLRRQLARLGGVGPAAAQAILLSLGRAAYPLDRGTYRILARHGWIDHFADAEETRQELCRLAGDDCKAISRLAYWLSRVGRQFCVPGTPKCLPCPLCGLLPENGPLEPDN